MADGASQMPARWIRPEQINADSDFSETCAECAAGGLVREIVKLAQTFGWWTPLDYAQMNAAFLAQRPGGNDEELERLLDCLERHELVFRGDDGLFRATDELLKRCVAVAPARHGGSGTQ